MASSIYSHHKAQILIDMQGMLFALKIWDIEMSFHITYFALYDAK